MKKKINKNNKKKIIEILQKFDSIPFFIKYYNKEPSDDELTLIERLCILFLIFSQDKSIKGQTIEFILNNKENKKNK